MKRTGIFILIALLLILPGCGDAPKSDKEAAALPTEADNLQARETVADISPLIPQKDYGGFGFNILALDSSSETWVVKDVFASEQNGDAINDAVYMRNRRVEEKYNINIEQTLMANPSATAKNSIMSGDDTYDIVQTTVIANLSLATQGFIYELGDIPYIDISNNWWDDSTIKSTELAGKVFILLGDINIVDDEATWCMFFNKQIIEDYNLPDIYKVVNDNEWTLDKMREYCRDIYSDLNGNGERDQNDQWGLLASGNAAMTLLWSSDIMLSKPAGEDIPTLNIQEENVVRTLNAVYDIFTDNTVILQVEKISYSEGIHVGARAMFREGRAFLYIGTVANVTQYRDMEIDFGILPLPKYDTNQKDYVSTFQSWSGTCYSVPATATDVERTGIILEALASASVNTLTPAYYETALERKYTRDDESSEMLDLIFRTRRFDLVYAFDWGGIRSALPKSLTKDTNTIVSDLVSIETKMRADLENAYNVFCAPKQ